MAAASPRRPERTRETMEGVSNDAAQSIAPSTETTNITPGPRAQRLQDLYGKSLERTLSKLSWENFAACYPTIAKKSEGTLKQVQEQMVAKLQEKCEKEFDNIMVSRQVVAKLNELEILVADASVRKQGAGSDDATPIPPHMLPPNAILTAHLLPSFIASQSQLNARLQTTQAQNALLADQVKQQRTEIDELLKQLESAMEDVRGANAALAPLVDDLAAEARASNAS